MTCSLYYLQSKAMYLECEDPPGATSSDYLSEAAKVKFAPFKVENSAKYLNNQSTCGLLR